MKYIRTTMESIRELMIAGHLTKQSRKAKKPEAGFLTVGHEKAIWWTDATDKGRILQALEKPEILNVSSHLVHLRGFEYTGVEKTGIRKYTYQEWYITK